MRQYIVAIAVAVIIVAVLVGGVLVLGAITSGSPEAAENYGEVVAPAFGG